MSNFYKHPQYGMVYCGETVTPKGRICWPASLVTAKDAPPPKEGQAPGKPRFEGTLILNKLDPAVIKFVEDLAAVIAEGLVLFNKGNPTTLGINSIFGKYGDGDAWDAEKYPYYKGHWVLTARNSDTPKVVDANRNSIEPQELKGGMPGRFVMTPLITAHGASYKLLIVQKFDGDFEPIAGGARNVMGLLEELAEAAEEEKASVPVEVVAVEAPKKATKGKAAAINLLA